MHIANWEWMDLVHLKVQFEAEEKRKHGKQQLQETVVVVFVICIIKAAYLIRSLNLPTTLPSTQ